MSFKKCFVESQLLVSGVVDNRDITQDNWTSTPEKIAKVMEEVGKISEYYSKEDIEI